MLGDAGDGRVRWAPDKEWTTSASVRPALAISPSFETMAPFPEVVALSG